MKTHELKTWPRYFQAVWDRKKPWEFRKDDRNYEVGDVLILNEWDYNKDKYTGRKIKASVPYLLRDKIFVPSGFVILSLAEIENIPRQNVLCAGADGICLFCAKGDEIEADNDHCDYDSQKTDQGCPGFECCEQCRECPKDCEFLG